jgi:hypothetical protein
VTPDLPSHEPRFHAIKLLDVLDHHERQTERTEESAHTDAAEAFHCGRSEQLARVPRRQSGHVINRFHRHVELGYAGFESAHELLIITDRREWPHPIFPGYFQNGKPNEDEALSN